VSADRVKLNQIIDGIGTQKLGYGNGKLSPDTVEYYHKVVDQFEKLAQEMASDTRANHKAAFDRPGDGDVPMPKMRFRLRPVVDNDPRSLHIDLPDQLDSDQSS
jgi:hypothetical protein